MRGWAQKSFDGSVNVVIDKKKVGKTHTQKQDMWSWQQAGTIQLEKGKTEIALEAAMKGKAAVDMILLTDVEGYVPKGGVVVYKTNNVGLPGGEDAAMRSLTEVELKEIKRARISLDVFGSNGGQHQNKHLFLNGNTIAKVPVSKDGDIWERYFVEVPKDKLKLIAKSNKLQLNTVNGDHYKFGRLCLAVQLKSGEWVVCETHKGVYSSAAGWPYREGKVFINDKSPEIELKF